MSFFRFVEDGVIQLHEIEEDVEGLEEEAICLTHVLTDSEKLLVLVIFILTIHDPSFLSCFYTLTD